MKKYNNLFVNHNHKVVSNSPAACQNACYYGEMAEIDLEIAEKLVHIEDYAWLEI